MSETEGSKTRSIIPRHESQRIAFGAFIRQRRKQLMLSQKMISERAATKQATVSAWENGKTFPIDGHFSALAQALELTKEELRAAIPKGPHVMTEADTRTIHQELSVDDLEFLLGITKQLPGQKLSWELFIQLLQEKQRPSSEGGTDGHLNAEVLTLAKATKPGKPNPLFGQALQKWRKEQKISPSEFARRVGVSPQTIHRWEKGYAPRAIQLERLRHALSSEPIPSAEPSPTAQLELLVHLPRDQGQAALMEVLTYMQKQAKWTIVSLTLR